MKRVCIDTDILGWAIKGYVTDGDEEKVTQARYLIDYLQSEGMIIFIPSIVVAEMMSDVEDEEEREEISDYVSKNFRVMQFDIICARIFAEIRINKRKERGELRDYREENSVGKCEMINDWLITSVAIANNCDVIFTNNQRDFTRFAGDLINIESLSIVENIKEYRKEQVRIQEERDKKQIIEESAQVNLFTLDELNDFQNEEE